MFRRGVPALASYVLLAAACTLAQMVVIPTAASPHARPWTLTDDRPGTLRVPADIDARATTTTAPPPTTTTTAVPATTTTTAPPTTTTRPVAPPAPPPPAAAVPARGQATADGCDAALAYLRAYAEPGFTLECPGYAEGHEGMTCMNESACPGAALIAIADACPQTYMNEASNSWVLTGRSDAPIDPYGACP